MAHAATLCARCTHDDDTVRAAVVRARDRAEALLPSRVPLEAQWSGVGGGEVRTGDRGRTSRVPGAAACAHPPPPTPLATHDLKLDGLAVELDGADLKVHANRRDVRLRVRVVRCGARTAAREHPAMRKRKEPCSAAAKSVSQSPRSTARRTPATGNPPAIPSLLTRQRTKTQEQTRLSDTGVANQQELKEKVAAVMGGWGR